MKNITLYNSEITPFDSTEYYVAIDHVDLISEGTAARYRLDGVTVSWADSNQSQPLDDTSFINEMRPVFFEFIDDNFKVLKKFNHKQPHPFEQSWLKATISKTKSEIIIYDFPYDEIFTEETNNTNYLIKLEIVQNPNIIQYLDKKFSLDSIPDASDKSITEAINSLINPNTYVSTYNVGQGNFSAICDENKVPLLYFDLGGGCFWNHHTYPTVLIPCTTFRPLIILSHWDMDHIETARRDFVTQKSTSRLLKSLWLAPRQQLTPSYTKLALTVHNVGKLMIWPNNTPKITTLFGDLIKCTGFDKNNTGLAFDIHLTTTNHSFTNILLPGDAAYKYIPGIDEKSYHGILATHHGAEFADGNSPVPNATGPQGICYSYGHNNTYCHPRTQAQTAHTNAGWNNALDTTNGGIALINTNNYLPGHALCQGRNCTLFIQQSF